MDAKDSYSLDKRTEARRAPLSARPTPFLRRNRVVFIFALVTQAFALALFLAYGLYTNSLNVKIISSPQIINTALLNFMATLLGYWVIQRFNTHPGVRSHSITAPAMTTSFAVFAILMLMLRTEYSRGLFVFGFFIAIIAFAIFLNLVERKVTPFLAIIPYGNLRGVENIKSAKWLLLETTGDMKSDCSGVVTDLTSDLPDGWQRFIAKCILAGIPVHDAKGVIESFMGRVEIEHIAENHFGSTLPSNAYLRLKRLIDFSFAVILFLPFAVIIAVAVVAIKIESPGKALFAQQRVGFRSHLFWIYKLRSMHADASNGLRYTEKGDPRITEVGKFIRKYRIDELPQIFNILRGDMSWIGPRPESVLLTEIFAAEVPFHTYRHAVPPGITGWAQVNQGNVGNVEDEILKLQYDFYYIKKFSPWLDLLIAMKTIRTIFIGAESI